MGEEEHDVAGEAGGDRPQALSPPTPARTAMAPVPATEGPPAPGPSATVEVDGSVWRVRVVGRTLGGRAPTAVPLLLLGFERPEGAPEEDREGWAAAPGLDAMGPAALESAFRGARPPRHPWVPAPFFPEIAARGGRDT